MNIWWSLFFCLALLLMSISLSFLLPLPFSFLWFLGLFFHIFHQKWNSPKEEITLIDGTRLGLDGILSESNYKNLDRWGEGLNRADDWFGGGGYVAGVEKAEGWKTVKYNWLPESEWNFEFRRKTTRKIIELLVFHKDMDQKKAEEG